MPLARLGSGLFALCLVVGACSGGDEPRSGAASAPSAAGSDRKEARAGSGLDKSDRSGAQGSPEPDSRGRRASTPLDRSSGGRGPGRPTRQGRGERERSTGAGPVAQASASRSDPSGDGDRQGSAPEYADIRHATVAGSGNLVRFSLRVDGPIPPEGTGEGIDMTASFHFRMHDGDEHQIYAIGSHSGWKADLDNSGGFPGRFALDGDTVVFELSWDRLGGAARMRWGAQTSWTRAADGPLDDTEFAFDQVPEYEKASYPE